MKPQELSPNGIAALTQASVAIGHAIDVLHEAELAGRLVTATELLGERYARLLNAAEAHALEGQES